MHARQTNDSKRAVNSLEKGSMRKGTQEGKEKVPRIEIEFMGCERYAATQDIGGITNRNYASRGVGE
jgi:hypothetical protein